MGTLSSSGKAATPHFEMVISAVKVAGLQRVGTLSSSGKAVTPHFETVISAVKVAGLQ